MNKKKQKISPGPILVLVMCVVAVIYYKNSLKSIYEGIISLSFAEISVCTVLAMAYFIIEGKIIHTLANPINPAYRVINGIKTAFLCEFYRVITLGSGSGIVEIFYLNRDGVPAANGTGMAFIQYIMKRITMMLLGICGFVYLMLFSKTESFLTDYWWAMAAGSAITIIIAGGMILIATSDRVSRICDKMLDYLAGKFPKYGQKLGGLKDNLSLLNETGKDLLTHKERMISVLFWDILKLTAIFFIPAFLFMGNGLSAVECVCLMAVIFMLSAVLPAPSGIGSLEFVFLLVFGNYMDEAITVPTILLYRFVTWIVPFLVGAVIYAVDKTKDVLAQKNKEGM